MSLSAGYVFFDIFNQVTAQNPVLRSPEFSSSQNDARCLSFWYAPFGRGEATALNVFRVETMPAPPDPNAEDEEEEEPKPARQLIWRMATRKFDTSSRPDWTYGQVSVASLTNHLVRFPCYN